MDRGKLKRIARTRRLMYVIACSGSSVTILWALIHMAISEPLYALAAAVGALIIAAARMDMLILGIEFRDTTRRCATGARTEDA